MGAGEHGNTGPFVSETFELIDDQLQMRAEKLTAGRKHQGVRSVVDVFRRAAEMNEFAGGSKMFIDGHLALNPVFNRLNVMLVVFSMSLIAWQSATEKLLTKPRR